jgi:hypothetical protein
VVSRALADGLKARGFQVIAATGETYLPRVSRAAARVAIAGELKEFWTEAFYTNKAECKVQLQLYDMATGRKLWEKEYAARDSEGLGGGAFASLDGLRDRLVRQLAQVITEVVNDPELFSQVGRP